jgi:lipopolysaccharide export LptBFGC system permease protein LptF
MDRIFLIINLLVNKGLEVSSALMLIIYSLPTLLVLSMPMGVLSGGILTFGKMASDGEITVIRTSGNPLKPLVVPIILTSILITLIMIPFNYYIAPTSQFQFRRKFLSIAIKDPALRLEESTLIEIPPYTLLCLDVNHKKKLLKEVIIYKNAGKDEPSISITARNGNWTTNANGELILNLFNGRIRHQPDTKPEKLSNIAFENYSITLMSPKNIKKISKDIESMTATELKEEIRRLKEKDLPTHKLAARLHMRGSLAAAIPVLLMVGIPFGIRAEKKGKTVGIGMSLGVIAFYYFLMVAGIKLAFNQSLPPLLGVWLPNIIVGIAGIIMLRKSYYK